MPADLQFAGRLQGEEFALVAGDAVVNPQDQLERESIDDLAADVELGHGRRVADVGPVGWNDLVAGDPSLDVGPLLADHVGDEGVAAAVRHQALLR